MCVCVCVCVCVIVNDCVLLFFFSFPPLKPPTALRVSAALFLCCSASGAYRSGRRDAGRRVLELPRDGRLGLAQRVVAGVGPGLSLGLASPRGRLRSPHRLVVLLHVVLGRVACEVGRGG